MKSSIASDAPTVSIAGSRRARFRSGFEAALELVEEIGVDPMAHDPEGFRWRTHSQIEEGRSWLWSEGETILFKAEASAWTPLAVQLQQVWVDPEARGR